MSAGKLRLQIIKERNLKIETRIGDRFHILVLNQLGQMMKSIEQPSIALVFEALDK